MSKCACNKYMITILQNQMTQITRKQKPKELSVSVPEMSSTNYWHILFVRLLLVPNHKHIYKNTGFFYFFLSFFLPHWFFLMTSFILDIMPKFYRSLCYFIMHVCVYTYVYICVYIYIYNANI